MCWFSFQTLYGLLLVLLSLTKEPAQFRAALSDQPHEQLWHEDLGPCESPLQRLQIPVRERLQKLWCRVVSTRGPCGSCTVRVTLPCIWQGACFCELGCFLSGCQLLKWEEFYPRWCLSCRYQSSWILIPNQCMVLCKNNCPQTAQDAVSCSPVDYQYPLYQAVCEEILSEVLILRSVCYSPVWLLDLHQQGPKDHPCCPVLDEMLQQLAKCKTALTVL